MNSAVFVESSSKAVHPSGCSVVGVGLQSCIQRRPESSASNGIDDRYCRDLASSSANQCSTWTTWVAEFSPPGCRGAWRPRRGGRRRGTSRASPAGDWWRSKSMARPVATRAPQRAGPPPPTAPRAACARYAMGQRRGAHQTPCLLSLTRPARCRTPPHWRNDRRVP